MTEDDQHGIGKIFTVHAPKLAQPRTDRKPRPADDIFIEPFAGFWRLTLRP
jgi:hypothetical protein